ncbi:RnfABCDGE type electron transport complex subunit B [Caedibacter taeniospiralis]|uniref:RnfABCDGE type electron transport complex subunit B n=1 Tax=Caedibacter taeniospiralis TaxID=28907 RepID=UPI000C27E1E8|nr:RnfABCDGE type electron transport complex subunit B [Caedibacter taeniospiralis]
MIVSVDAIDAILPQTQCTKCGYQDCYDYAKAIKNGEKHNRCPPGAQEGADKLAHLLQRETLALDESCGKHQPKQIAWINENLCIGCMKCILACPVDAIIGAKKLMHTVIEEECTGCDLCVEPCPMDCIEMRELPLQKQPKFLSHKQNEAQKNHYRLKHNQRKFRMKQQKVAETQKHQQNIELNNLNIDKKAYIQQALANFKAKKKLD